jgi:hypothetical protein
MKRIALIMWTGAVVVVTVIEAVNAGKRLTWDEVVAVTVFLAAIAMTLFEGRSQGLRELSQRPIPRVLTLIVLVILGFLMLAPILRFD